LQRGHSLGGGFRAPAGFVGASSCGLGPARGGLAALLSRREQLCVDRQRRPDRGRVDRVALVVEYLLAELEAGLVVVELGLVGVSPGLTAQQLGVPLGDARTTLEAVCLGGDSLDLERVFLLVMDGLFMIDAHLFAVGDALVELDHRSLIIELAPLPGRLIRFRLLGHAIAPSSPVPAFGITSGAGRLMWNPWA